MEPDTKIDRPPAKRSVVRQGRERGTAVLQTNVFERGELKSAGEGKDRRAEIISAIWETIERASKPVEGTVSDEADCAPRDKVTGDEKNNPPCVHLR